MYMPQLTETVRTVRKDHPGAFRYKWEFSDGPARFEAVFIDRVSHVDPEDGRPCAVMTVIQILSDESEGRIWSYQYQVKRARNGMLYSNPYLDADYASLKAILQIRSSGEGHPWKVEEFLQRADMSSKQVAGRWEKSEIWYASQLPPSMRNDVEESDKLVFVGLKLNPEGQHQTTGNYLKTMRLISKEIADYCRRTNQSTRWTEHAPSGETENRLLRSIIEVQRYSHLD